MLAEKEQIGMIIGADMNVSLRGETGIREKENERESGGGKVEYGKARDSCSSRGR